MLLSGLSWMCWVSCLNAQSKGSKIGWRNRIPASVAQIIVWTVVVMLFGLILKEVLPLFFFVPETDVYGYVRTTSLVLWIFGLFVRVFQSAESFSELIADFKELFFCIVGSVFSRHWLVWGALYWFNSSFPHNEIQYLLWLLVAPPISTLTSW